MEKLGVMLIFASDICNCVSGDFHTMHLNFQDEEFDTMHKKVLKKYYEQSADDYDALAEFARMVGQVIPATNESASRTGYESAHGVCTRPDTVMSIDTLIGVILNAMVLIYEGINKIDSCPQRIGISNYLQTRIEYWVKEKDYFNKSRGRQKQVVEVTI